MAKLSLREIEKYKVEAGEVKCEQELDLELTPHEQAVENIRDYIEMDLTDSFGDNKRVCDIHGRLVIGEVACRECAKTLSLALDTLDVINRQYKLEPFLFNYGMYEDLVRMHYWLELNGTAWFEQDREELSDIPDERLHPSYCTEKYKAVQKFKKILKSKNLNFKLDKDLKCENTPYELTQIIDAWLEYNNNHDLEMMRNANAA